MFDRYLSSKMYLCDIKSITMAKAIKITPVLRGKDAVRFLQKLTSTGKTKVSKETLLSIRKDAKQLQSIFKAR